MSGSTIVTLRGVRVEISRQAEQYTARLETDEGKVLELGPGTRTEIGDLLWRDHGVPVPEVGRALYFADGGTEAGWESTTRQIALEADRIKRRLRET